MIGTHLEALEGNVPEGDYAGGNYRLRMFDGSPTKIFRNGNEMLGERYSSNSFIGRSIYNTLLSGRNAVLPEIGDSTSNDPNNWIYQLAQKLGASGIAKVILHKFDNDIELLRPVEVMQNSVPTAIEENGLDFNGGEKGTPQYPDNLRWSSPDLSVEFRLSNWDVSKSGAYAVAKWDGGTTRSFYVRLDNADVKLLWFDDVSDKNIDFTDALLGAVSTDINHFKIDLDVDNGASGHTATLYKTLDDGVNWTQIDEQINAGTTSIKKGSATEYNLNGNSNGTSDFFTREFKLHKAIIRNGIGGEVCCLPINIESWITPSNTNGCVMRGSKPTLNIVNGSVSGYSYSAFTDAKLKKCTVPDYGQTFIINHGHNQGWDGYDALYNYINDFVERVNAILGNSKYIFSTQNPWADGWHNADRQQSTPLVGSVNRDYAILNNHGCLDFMAAIPETIPDWQTLMMDPVHPDSDLPALLYGYMADCALHFITGR